MESVESDKDDESGGRKIDEIIFFMKETIADPRFRFFSVSFLSVAIRTPDRSPGPRMIGPIRMLGPTRRLG
jgi:hypothetical protein